MREFKLERRDFNCQKIFRIKLSEKQKIIEHLHHQEILRFFCICIKWVAKQENLPKWKKTALQKYSEIKIHRILLHTNGVYVI